MIEERVRLSELRERIRRIERPTRRPMGRCRSASPRSIAVLPGGGLARGALHEILGMGGDEEDGALAAAFAAGILGAAGENARTGTVLWCLPRSDLYGPGLAAHGLDPARLVLVRRARRRDPVGGRGRAAPAARLAAVVGEVGRLPMVGGPPAAARRRALRRHRLSAAALAQRRQAAARTQPAERGGDPLADRGVAFAAAIAGEARASGWPALAGRAVALPRRRAGMLGGGGGRCDGSCISGCRAGRSTGCAGLGACRKHSGAPAEEAPFATVADDRRAAPARRGQPGRGGGRPRPGHAAGRCAVLSARPRHRRRPSPRRMPLR